MKLSTKIQVTEKYKGVSKFPFWKNLNVGDILVVSTYVKGVGRGANGLYATSIYFHNLTQDEKFNSTMTFASKYLSNFKYSENV